MKKICLFLLVVCLVGCASLTEFTWQRQVTFSTEFDRVWNACVAELMSMNYQITLSDKDAGLLVAQLRSDIINYGDRLIYTVNVTRLDLEVVLDVHVDLPPLHGRASKYVDKFMAAVDARLR